MVPEPSDPRATESAPGKTAPHDEATELARGEEPVVQGTLFVVIIILAIIAAIWVIMYLRLLDR